MTVKYHLMAALSFLAFAGMSLCACEDEPPVQTTTVSSQNQVTVKKSTRDRVKQEMTRDGWRPVQVSEQTIQSRNPFRGFSDTILAEAMMRKRLQEEHLNDVQLPEQVYPTRDYKVISVITGTADPKAYVVDPSGNRFVLRRGSLIGNNNGSISSIRREGVEVYERVADKGQYIELPLFEKQSNDRSKIQILLK